MSVIRILPEEVSNRIAAGEVVERPASVVKELAENALDAGAGRIAIQIQRGGRSLIRVIDNGCGMDAEDAQLCLEAHATSKLKTADDISQIATMGFRGEAIPSIASVSRFALQTRTVSNDVGVELSVAGGVLEDLVDCGCAPGTSVTVRNLFYNVPARQKFLRAIRTEETHIEALVVMLALSHPDVAFQLTFDGRVIIDVHKNTDLATRVHLLLGRDLSDVLLPVDFQELAVRVHGFVARPGLTRSSRKEQRTFVNGRPVEARAIYAGIRDAYHTLVTKGRYPPVVLFVELPPEQVDINVHPAKREVRFFNDRIVTQTVCTGVQRSLRALVTTPDFLPGPAVQAPQAATSSPPEAAPAAAGALGVSPPGPTAPQPRAPVTVPLPRIPSPAPHQPDLPRPPASSRSATAMPVGPQPGSAASGELKALTTVGRLGRSLVLAEGKDGLVVLDVRAAHERIVFERMLEGLGEAQAPSQGLLIPLTIDLTPADSRTLGRNMQELERLGFAIEEISGNSFLVSAVPTLFPNENLHGMLREILDELAEESAKRKRGDERRVARIACRAAAGARGDFSDEEVQVLMADLLKTQMPYTCPAGRPTMISISNRELERRFGRQL